VIKFIKLNKTICVGALIRAFIFSEGIVVGYEYIVICSLKNSLRRFIHFTPITER